MQVNVKKGKEMRIFLHADLISPSELFQRHVQQRLPHKPPTGIKHGGRTRRALVLLLDFAEGLLDAVLAGHIRGYPQSFAAVLVDLLHQRFEVIRVPSEEDDGIGRGETAGHGGAGPGANAGDDGDCFRAHDCIISN